MKIGIIGAGVMGRGIAQVSATAGHQVVLFEINDEVLQIAKTSITGNLSKALELGKIDAESVATTHENICYSNNIADVEVDLVIEAIVEKLDVKKDLFGSLESQNSAATILASNTSSIPITQIASGLKRPENFVGIHFFNPACTPR